jgi:hypothetical protein
MRAAAWGVCVCVRAHGPGIGWCGAGGSERPRLLSLLGAVQGWPRRNSRHRTLSSAWSRRGRSLYFRPSHRSACGSLARSSDPACLRLLISRESGTYSFSKAGVCLEFELDSAAVGDGHWSCLLSCRAIRGWLLQDRKPARCVHYCCSS